MRRSLVFLFVLTSFVLAPFVVAQSFSGTYTLQNEASESISLTLEEIADGSLEGSIVLGDLQLPIRGKVTGAGTATGEFVPETGDTEPPSTFSLQLKEPQLLFTDTESGEMLTLTRGTAPTTQTTQTQPTQEPKATLPNDPKLQECITFLDSDEAATDAAKVEECQTYIQTVLGPGGTDNDGGETTGLDAKELAYCQEFLADAEAVAEDPEEKSYCEEYVKTYGTQTNPTTPTTTETNPLNAQNPLSTNAPENPLTTKLDAFSGVYRGENIGLTLQLADGQYSGTLEFNGQTYPVQGAEQESKLVGSFQVNGSPFEFVFYLQDTFFTLESGGQKYNLMKQP
jgi:hypothetical protein